MEITKNWMNLEIVSHCTQTIISISLSARYIVQYVYAYTICFMFVHVQYCANIEVVLCISIEISIICPPMWANNNNAERRCRYNLFVCKNAVEAILNCVQYNYILLSKT